MNLDDITDTESLKTYLKLQETRLTVAVENIATLTARLERLRKDSEERVAKLNGKLNALQGIHGAK